MADRKMSLNELSEKVGVSNVNLSKLKTGKVSAVRFSTLEAICEALDCQPGDILEYKKDWKTLPAFLQAVFFHFINSKTIVITTYITTLIIVFLNKIKLYAV